MEKYKKIILLLFLSILAVSRLVCLKNDTLLASSPKLHCEEADFNAGRIDVRRDSPFVHVFKLENKTTQQIKITGYRVSCSCAEVGFESTEIPPLGSLDLPVRVAFSEQNFKPFTIVVLLLTDSNEKNPLKLSITVASSFRPYLSQDSVSFGDVYLHRKEVKTIFAYRPENSLKSKIIDSIKYNSDAIEIKRKMLPFENVNETKRSYYTASEALEISIMPTVDGNVSEEVEILFETGEKKTLTINYNALPANKYIPDKYLVREEDLSEGYEFSITFIPNAGETPNFSMKSFAFAIKEVRQIEEKCILNIILKNEVKNNDLRYGHFLNAHFDSGMTISMPIEIIPKP